MWSQSLYRLTMVALLEPTERLWLREGARSFVVGGISCNFGRHRIIHIDFELGMVQEAAHG